MKNMICIALAILPIACLGEDAVREATTEQADPADRFNVDDDDICTSVPLNSVMEKKGIVDCNNRASKKDCKECGNGGTLGCCPPQPGWECDVLCDNWVYDPKNHDIKWCP